eukprot:CAMPEP_0113468620 /NCGR_PEP_ID=MMETSP0014_2-20120614/15455_1 /TAXON_ID=2857 /ORGANISM="Nitzschia sp." /LENGTH=465 /DNA_ID=CAMNT_0000361027 /DNA_START=296 /DNA_END=1690 /DNA_ORIENTATION=+ /assembly_acc=CAM_ASM_000159
MTTSSSFCTMSLKRQRSSSSTRRKQRESISPAPSSSTSSSSSSLESESSLPSTVSTAPTSSSSSHSTESSSASGLGAGSVHQHYHHRSNKSKRTTTSDHTGQQRELPLTPSAAVTASLCSVDQDIFHQKEHTQQAAIRTTGSPPSTTTTARAATTPSQPQPPPPHLTLPLSPFSPDSVTAIDFPGMNTSFIPSTTAAEREGEQGKATASGPPPSTMSTTMSTLKSTRGLSVVWRTPRPVIASMLNNKGVIQIEREQYDEARKSLSKALKIAMKEKCQQQHQQLMQHYDNNQQQQQQEQNSLPIAPPLHVAPGTTTTAEQQQQQSTNSSTKTAAAAATTTAPNNILRTVSDSSDSDLGSLNNNARNNTSILEESCLSPCTNPVDVFDNIQLTNNLGVIDAQDDNDDDEGDDHDVKNNTDGDACTSNSQRAQHYLDSINGVSSPSTTKSKHRAEYDEGMDVYKAPFR